MISLKRVKTGILMLSLVTVLSACNNNEGPIEKGAKGSHATVAISGSTSVGPLAEKLAHAYSEQDNESKHRILNNI